MGDDFVDVPLDAAAVVSVAPLGAAVVSDESPLLQAVASTEIAAIAISESVTDLICLFIWAFHSGWLTQPSALRFVASPMVDCRSTSDVRDTSGKGASLALGT